MTNLSMRAAVQSGALDGSARVAKGMTAPVFLPPPRACEAAPFADVEQGFAAHASSPPTARFSSFGVHGSLARRGLAAVLRMDRVRLVAQARARRRGRHGLLRARVR